MLRRGIFRKLKAIILEKISELCDWAANYINGFDPSFLDIFNEFQKVKAVYLNNEQKKSRAFKRSQPEDDSDDDESTVLGVMKRVCYKYSKKAVEEFFMDSRLNHLFNFFADEIIERGHQTSEGRCKTAVPDEKVANVNFQQEV